MLVGETAPALKAPAAQRMGFLDKDIEQLDGVSHVERVRMQRQREDRGKPASGAVEEEAPLNQPDAVLQVNQREHTGCKCCDCPDIAPRGQIAASHVGHK